jgi:threonine dehydratase
VELQEQHSGLAAAFASVGGGGLISGIGWALRGLGAQTQIVGCWPENAPTLQRCIEAGRVIEVEESDTISDGTAGGVEPNAITLPIARSVIDQSVLVSESEIRGAMKRLALTDRWMIEGAAGVALASFLKIAPAFEGRSVAVVLCGRNIKLDTFIEAVR